MKARSLKVQLLKSLALPVVLSILLISGLCYWSAEDEITEVYDSQLITAANTLWLLNRYADATTAGVYVQPRLAALDAEDQKALDEYAKWRAFRVWKAGKLVMQSDNARPVGIAYTPKGFSDFIWNNTQWRAFTLSVPEEGIVVEVAEQRAARTEIISSIMLGLLSSLLAVLPVIAFLLWKGIQQGLKDVRHFAGLIQQRSPDDLSQVNPGDAPRELLPLADALNQLLAKLGASLAQERLFTDNAAHELRTPLAALSIQAQVVQGSRNEKECQDAIEELSRGVARASRLLEQLLTLARLRHQPATLECFDLSAHACEIIKAHIPQALKKGVAVALDGAEEAEVMSNRALLSLLIGNVLDNAIKYTPPHGSVLVKVQSDASVSTLVITDTGPGIPHAERENVFQRFYRLPGVAESGSGLGLSIARQIAELLHIRLVLFTPECASGLGMKLIFSRT